MCDNFFCLAADNVAERDYLRTEGDPGAAGYTIKEAVALTRSVVCYVLEHIYLSVGCSFTLEFGCLQQFGWICIYECIIKNFLACSL